MNTLLKNLRVQRFTVLHEATKLVHKMHGAIIRIKLNHLQTVYLE